MPVIAGTAKYPENLVEKISALGINIVAFDALSLAKEAGNAKSVNIVLMVQLHASSTLMTKHGKVLLTDAFLKNSLSLTRRRLSLA